MKTCLALGISIFTIVIVHSACSAGLDIGISVAAGMIMFVSAMGGIK